MQPMVNLALRAARNAGLDLASRLDRFDAYQSTDTEKAKFIADCTIGIEKNIIFELKKPFPEHNFCGRETGLNGDQSRQPTWHICVIDDIPNFRVGIPAFAISIACVINGKTEHAVVTNPLTNEEFTASRGRGAQLNNRRIRCSSAHNLADVMVGFTQPAGSNENVYIQHERVLKLMAQPIELRNFGSNALSICYTAANRFQAALLSQVDDFSLIAAGLVASEAGCLLASANGQPLIKAPANIVVANPRLMKAVLGVIA